LRAKYDSNHKKKENKQVYVNSWNSVDTSPDDEMSFLDLHSMNTPVEQSSPAPSSLNDPVLPSYEESMLSNHEVEQLLAQQDKKPEKAHVNRDGAEKIGEKIKDMSAVTLDVEPKLEWGQAVKKN
jgi:hypothetical protein